MAALTCGDIGEREVVTGEVRRLGEHVLPQRELLAQALRLLLEVRIVCAPVEVLDDMTFTLARFLGEQTRSCIQIVRDVDASGACSMGLSHGGEPCSRRAAATSSRCS